MIRPSYIFTSESVSEGHPDKVADRISDEVVDAFLSRDPFARVACETLVTTNRILLAGEVRTADDALMGEIVGGCREHDLRIARRLDLARPVWARIDSWLRSLTND